MYRSKEMFCLFVLFLVVQKQMSDNYANAEVQISKEGLKNYNNNQDKSVPCDQCFPIIIFNCTQEYLTCDVILFSNTSCHLCSKLQTKKSFESDGSSFSQSNSLENMSSERAIPQEFYDPAARTQYSDDESVELNSSAYNSSEQLNFTIGLVKISKRNLCDHCLHNSTRFILEDYPVGKFICYVMCIFFGIILLVIGIFPFFSNADKVVISMSTFKTRYSKMSLPPTVGNYIPMGVVRSKDDNPPPSYEQSTKNCTLEVRIEVDESQPQVKSV